MISDKGQAVSCQATPQSGGCFWERFLRSKVIFGLWFAVALGAAAGTACGLFCPFFQERRVFPLVFSGIPTPGAGYLSCFTTLLLNTALGLLPLFLLGFTAFGAIAVPAFLFFRGMAAGLAVSFYLWETGAGGLLTSALLYGPAAAGSGTLLLLFSGRALAFSHELAQAGYACLRGRGDAKRYLEDFLAFLSLAVGASMIGGVPAALWGIFCQ